jgi:DegT/DnrJ/EryC1/StrS aminotransferase family
VARLLDEGVALGLSKAQPEIGAIERALAEFHGVPWALGTSTGQGALYAALIGLELTAGDEVITSPYSWGVSVSCILQNNCIPMFADVTEGLGLLDPESVRERLTWRTRPQRHRGRKPGARRAPPRSDRRLSDASGFSANGVKPIAATEGGLHVGQGR